jgi:hypothetical protein
MERAIDKARSPDILMIPIPPRPKGVAIAAIVEPFMYKDDECGMMNAEKSFFHSSSIIHNSQFLQR